MVEFRESLAMDDGSLRWSGNITTICGKARQIASEINTGKARPFSAFKKGGIVLPIKGSIVPLRSLPPTCLRLV